MLDTGALVPVWTTHEEMLLDMDAVLVKKGVPFGGFGGETRGNLYTLPVFRIGDLIFPELPIIAAPQRLPCQMLLSATMFGGLIYEIDDHNYRLNITIPNGESFVRKLIIDDKMRVLCMSGDV